MSERLGKEDKLKVAEFPTPIIQVNATFGLGGIRRETAGAGGSGEPWEKGAEDWRKKIGRHTDLGFKKLVVSAGRAGGPPDFPITCEEMGSMEDGRTGRFRAYLQFYGIDLSGARFLTIGEYYLRPPGSDSAVCARLGGGTLVLATFGDIIDCQFRVSGRQPYERLLGNFHFDQLSNYDPRQMGISVNGGNLVAVGYPRL